MKGRCKGTNFGKVARSKANDTVSKKKIEFYFLNKNNPKKMNCLDENFNFERFQVEALPSPRLHLRTSRL